MLRISLCLLALAMFVSAAQAAPQQGHTDVQSLQYEFGRAPRVQPQVTPMPCPCLKPVVCCPPIVYRCCTPCYNPCYKPCYKPVFRRAFVRPAYSPCGGCW